MSIKEKSGLEREQDFVVGWCNFLPYLIQKNQDILESDIRLEFTMGPGVSLTGELLWDSKK